MNAEAYARRAPLPVALDRETGAPLSLADWLKNTSAEIEPAELALSQRIALVCARWRAGGWHDVLYGTEGAIDLDRAIREVEAQSDMGKHLLAIGLRAIAMAREDARAPKAGDVTRN